MRDPDRLADIKRWRANDALPGGDDIDWLIEIADLYLPLVDILHAAPTARVGMGTADVTRALIGEVERLRQGDEFSRMHAQMVGLHRGFEVKEAEIDWLVGEVERLRGEVNHLDRLRWSDHGGELGDEPWQPPYPESEQEELRLRELLARLEWAGTNPRNPVNPRCPVCDGWPANGHYPGCWLAAELHPQTP